ncbi:hypothetical protein BGZ61DRAFT_19574 [Ilyonectria robusta]|uniref:uncharacterized protein n=1 Tax=Ilyonectria robusta TaxID=1079257 RepID=UPI001E8E4326|nr:uncharacterized protein BGZ61DRAFT_19574 [Ilyonectria robusta]KAH8737633.1 hypothetical protein BGZ61DRAFT_19574 [Ilyonectria robusta]
MTARISDAASVTLRDRIASSVGGLVNQWESLCVCNGVGYVMALTGIHAGLGRPCERATQISSTGRQNARKAKAKAKAKAREARQSLSSNPSINQSRKQSSKKVRPGAAHGASQRPVKPFSSLITNCRNGSHLFRSRPNGIRPNQKVTVRPPPAGSLLNLESVTSSGVSQASKQKPASR